MIDVRLLRTDPDGVRAALARRGSADLLAQLAEATTLEGSVRELQSRRDVLRAEVNDLSKQVGAEVKYIPVKSYPAAVAAFRNNQVQLAWFGGFTGVQARNLVPGSEAIAQGAEDTAFKTYFIAHAST